MSKRKLPSISLYKRIAVGFFVVTILLILVIAYFSWGKAVIKIEPKTQKTAVDFFINIGKRSEETENLANLIPAKILETTIEDSASYPTTGKKKISKKDITNAVIGKISVINKTGQAYDFVARTRFLSAEGILFRMKKAAHIPTDKIVEVDVYVDDNKFDGKLEATTFTIPGLSVDKQKLVYGSTEKDLVAGGEEVYYVTDEDVENAKVDFIQKLEAQALSELSNQLKFRERIFKLGTSIEVIDQKITPLVGEISENFELSLKVRVVAVSLDEKELSGEVYFKIVEQLPTGVELVGFDPEQIEYLLDKYDALGQIVTLKVSYIGDYMVSKDNKIFNKENLIGLDENGVDEYFASFDNVESVDVEFSPFWVRRIPNFIDSIDIILIK